MLTTLADMDGAEAVAAGWGLAMLGYKARDREMDNMVGVKRDLLIVFMTF